MAKDHGGDWLPLHRLAEPSNDSSPSTYDEPPAQTYSQPRLHSPSDDQYDPLLGTSSTQRGSSQIRHVLRHGLYLLPRLHRRTLLILLLLTTGFIAPVIMVVHTMRQYEMPPMHHLHNGAMRYTPDWSHGLVSIIFPSPEQKELEAPYLFDGILQAPWPGGYPIPELKLPQTLSQNRLENDASNSSRPLSSYSSSESTSEPAAFLMLHIFSTPRSQSRHKRQFIRNHSPLASVPLSHRHLVEVKFVIGYPDPNEPMTPEIEHEEEEIARENEQYGDVIRLKGLYHGENMNNGKSWEWLRWVGRPGGRQAWWVLKCDDDTLPIMPNLLPFLTEQNPREPVYLGTALGHWLGFHYYMEGMMYGFSWGVVKTLAEAVVDQETITGPWDEDAKMGTMMFSLPSKPSCPPISSFDRDRDRSTTHTDPCDPLTPPMSDRRWGSVPISPDPRSGLVRMDVGNRIGFRRSWYVARWKRALAWHGFKDDETYLDGWKQLHRMFKSHGREYLWTPPPTLEGYSSS